MLKYLNEESGSQLPAAGAIYISEFCVMSCGQSKGLLIARLKKSVINVAPLICCNVIYFHNVICV